jgi:two-component system copper resistance phosphate regulon response regulator CusR
MPHSAKILLVEDDAVIADAIASGLRDESFSVAVARDGTTGLWQAEQGAWDLVILDWWLPGLDGLALLESIRGQGMDTPVLMLTARDAVDDRVRGLGAGADDYLCKPFAFEELLARANALLRRSAGRSPLVRHEDVVVDLGRLRAWRGGSELSLSPRGVELLGYFVQHPDRPLSRHEVFEAIWREPYDPASRSLDVHVVTLRRQLERHGPRLLHTLRGIGFRFSRYPGGGQ